MSDQLTRQTGARLLCVPPEFRGFDYQAMARQLADAQPGLDVCVVDDALPEGDPSMFPHLTDTDNPFQMVNDSFNMTLLVMDFMKGREIEIESDEEGGESDSKQSGEDRIYQLFKSSIDRDFRIMLDAMETTFPQLDLSEEYDLLDSAFWSLTRGDHYQIVLEAYRELGLSMLTTMMNYDPL